MKKPSHFTVLAIFVTKWATPVLGCDSNSGCGDEAIRLVFAIIGAIMFISIIMVVVYCCIKTTAKQRESRGIVPGQCLCNRWYFSGGVYAEEGFTQNRYGGGDFGCSGYARSREFADGRNDRGDVGDGRYAGREFAADRYGGGDFGGSQYTGREFADSRYDSDDFGGSGYAGGEFTDGRYDGWDFRDSGYAGKEFADGIYHGGAFGDGGYAEGEFADGRYDRGDFADGRYAGGEFADSRYDRGDFNDSGCAGIQFVDARDDESDSSNGGYHGGTLLTAHALGETLVKAGTPGSNSCDGTGPLITL